MKSFLGLCTIADNFLKTPKSKKSEPKTDDNEDASDDDEEASEQEGEEEDEDEDENEEEGDEEEEDIPLSDLDDDEREDVIPHQRLTINNSAAINTSLKRISFVTPKTPFSEHNSLVSQEPIDVPDPDDDINRELAFYKVCQSAALTARNLLKKEGVQFTRPGDYFAEMVKSDEHMGRIKKKLYDEAANKKAAAEARKQRDLKKFGKQVQFAKLQQRQKEKRETLEKITALKKSEFSFLLSETLISAILMRSQSARLIPPALPRTPTTSSTSPLTTPTRTVVASVPVPTPTSPAPSARRGTRSSDSEERRGMLRAVMRRLLVICAASRTRR